MSDRHDLDRLTLSLIAFGTLLLLLQGLVAYQAVEQYRENVQLVNRTLELQEGLDQLYSAILESESSERGLIITQDPSYLAPYEAAEKAIDDELAWIRELLQSEPDQERRLQQLESSVSVRRFFIREIVGYCQAGDYTSAVELVKSGRGRAQMDEVREQIATMKSVQADLLDNQRTALRESAQTSGRIIVGGSALTVVVTLGYAMLIRRHLIRRRRAELERDRQFESSLDMLAVIDLDGFFRRLNDAWTEVSGYSREELQSRQLLDWIHPDDRPETERELERWQHGGESRGFENRFRMRDGGYRWLQWSCRSFPGDNILYAVARDVTERRQAQARREVQYGMARQLSATPSTLGALPGLMVDLAQGLGFDLANLWTVDELEGRLRIESSWSRPLPGLEVFQNATAEFPLELNTTLPGRVYHQRIPSWIGDVQQDAAFSRQDLARQAGLHGAIAFPLVVDGKVAAVMELLRRERLEQDPDLVQLVMSLSTQIAQSVERGRARESLERLSRQMELILKSAADGICGLDTDGRITFANPAALRLTGYSQAELLGGYLHDRIHQRADHGRSECPLLGAFRGDAEVGRRDGLSFPAELTVTPIREHGRMIGTVVSFRDITERKQVEKMKDEFVSVVSHELRTPLTSIRGSLGLLAGGVLGDLSPRAQRMLDIAVNNTDRLVRLINDILDIERMESGQVSLNLTACRTATLVSQALDVVRPLAERAQVELGFEVDDLGLTADSDRVVQALTNLISNAVKFSPEGERVMVRAARQGEDQVEFSVEDRGRGIPADKLDSIFGRFQQVDASDSREKGGSGLGLAICKSIALQHGGSIGVDSRPGEGSRFWFRLPLEPTGWRDEPEKGRAA